MTVIYADTIAALTAPAPPGAVIMLKRGLTYQGPVVFKSSGTSKAPIRLTAYGTGPAPVIKGAARIYTDALTITGSYVQIDSLAFSDTNRAGVQIAASASNVMVSHNEMTRVGEGVHILGSTIRCLWNNIHDLTMVKNTKTPTDDDYGANGFVVAGSHVELAFNTIRNAKAPSFDYGTDGGAFELFAAGKIADISIHDNWAEDCAGFIEGGGAYGTGATIANLAVTRNVSLNNGEFTSLHNAHGAFGAMWTNTRFLNNTVVEEAPDVKLVLVRADNPPTDILFSKNIFWMNGGDSIWKQTGADYHFDNAIYLGTPKTTHLFNNWGMGMSKGEVLTDPGFVNRARRNFALVAQSPAAGMGAK